MQRLILSRMMLTHFVFLVNNKQQKPLLKVKVALYTVIQIKRFLITDNGGLDSRATVTWTRVITIFCCKQFCLVKQRVLTSHSFD